MVLSVNNAKARIVRIEGHGVRGYVLFEAVSPKPLTDSEIADIQTKLGYMPMGYGGPDNVKRGEDIDGYLTTWLCQASCD